MCSQFKGVKGNYKDNTIPSYKYNKLKDFNNPKNLGHLIEIFINLKQFIIC